MLQFVIIVLCALLILAIFSRRWYLTEKGQMFGKMVFKKGMRLSNRMTKDDLEVTVKEMIPTAGEVDPKMTFKAKNLYRKGEVALKKDNAKDAEKLFIQALALDPSHIESHAQLALIYLKQQQPAKAELLYRKLILAIPDEVIYLSNLALALYQQGKLEEAKEYYEKAIEVDGSRAGRHFSLAQIFYELGEVEKAVQKVDNAIVQDDRNTSYYLTKAHWLVEQGITSEAKLVIQKTLEIEPHNVEAKAILRDLEALKQDV